MKKIKKMDIPKEQKSAAPKDSFCKKVWILFFAAMACLIVFHIAIAPAEEGSVALQVSDVFSIILAVLAFIAGYKSVKKLGMSSPQGKAMFYLTIGMALWVIAEMLWSIYGITGREFPLVSPADIFWLAAYPIMFAGLIIGFRAVRGMLKKETVILSLAIFTAILALIMVYVVYPIATDAEMSTALKAVTIAYPVGDLLLALGAIMIVVPLFGGITAKPWLWISLGMILFVVSDSVYSYLVYNEAYYIPGLAPQIASAFVSLSYYMAYLLVVVGFTYQIKMYQE